MRDQSLTNSLRRSRTELERGRLGPAVRAAWTAGNAATSLGDETALGRVVAIAREIADRSEGRHRREAEQLLAYCGVSIDQLASGMRPPSSLDRLLGRGWAHPKGQQTKRCPDCAEQVKAEARICRFCGHRFESGEAA